MVHLRFGDRDTLLVEAAADLVGRELISEADEGGDAFEGTLAMARHFAAHRSFYRAMLTGSCAFAMTSTLNRLFASVNEKAVRQLFGELDKQVARDLAAFVAGNTGAVVNNWLIDGADPLDPEELARRLRLPPPLTRDLTAERDLHVPMRDGAVLLADRWAPKTVATACRPRSSVSPTAGWA